MNYIWTERYRPETLDGYVFQNELQRKQIERWIADQDIPNLLIYGGPGTGKTTIARILTRELNLHKYDILDINASRERKLDNVRDKITNFVSTVPYGRMKVVLLDEADGLTPDAQKALRNLTEEYADTARYILTCNYGHKIIPALRSRCQEFPIEKLDITEFTARMAEVLIAESIEFDLDTLDSYVKTAYPDLRKCINLCQQNSISGILSLGDGGTGTADYRLDAVTLFKSGKFREARQLICKQLRPDEMNELISWCYNNLDLWSQTPEGQDEAILIIRRAAVNASLVADAEINVAALFVELTHLEK